MEFQVVACSGYEPELREIQFRILSRVRCLSSWCLRVLTCERGR